ncbi:hypothetical protein QFZ77_004445 [Paenibacillus sp. V4I3]|uniref:hypothetical protein n=1 Tax=unclassified Paenibacillus TaxID=185978 RepID=UPI00278A2266|nr:MULTISPECIES: hypothetical protein [unclassified Paenibacillus]MDQ0875786.1 hypothetical protein [Paenibacillus sp. V4I3]MDQ0888142.1 hypothetical protein [Paenibacillus sp. V4I9]
MKKKIKKMKVIGVGKWRIVYDLGNRRVIKVAKSKNGRLSNKKEIIVYKSAPSRIKKHLGKITTYGYGYRILVMKKYSRMFPRSKKYKRKLFSLRRTFMRNGIIPHDLNSNNLRLKSNGRIVFIDYGNFENRRKK